MDTLIVNSTRSSRTTIDIPAFRLSSRFGNASTVGLSRDGQRRALVDACMSYIPDRMHRLTVDAREAAALASPKAQGLVVWAQDGTDQGYVARRIGTSHAVDQATGLGYRIIWLADAAGLLLAVLLPGSSGLGADMPEGHDWSDIAQIRLLPVPSRLLTWLCAADAEFRQAMLMPPAAQSAVALHA